MIITICQYHAYGQVLSDLTFLELKICKQGDKGISAASYILYSFQANFQKSLKDRGAINKQLTFLKNYAAMNPISQHQ